MQIYILNRARETLATTSSIYDDKHTLTLDAGSSSYEFKIDKADEASQCMDTGNYVVLQDDIVAGIHALACLVCFINLKLI